MARYTCSFTVAMPLQQLHKSLKETLKACNLDIIYDSGDYIVAREIPGQVSFVQLVTVEGLIDKVATSEQSIRMNFVIKNEELPLQVDNHCRRIFETINRALAELKQWNLIDSVVT
jgi:hypothetical protein